MSNWTDKFSYEKELVDMFSKDSIYDLIRKHCRIWENDSFKLLRVTAVLTTRNDGSNALGEIIDGKIVAKEPFLRNSKKHKKDDDYIKEWLRLANTQLLRSGASFGLDVENIKYVLEKNSILNKVDCTSPGSSLQDDVKKIIDSRINDNSQDNPYRDSVILLFRWGSGSRPSGQACSGIDSRYITINRYRDFPLRCDGKKVAFVDNQLSHEFGHFMGLDHPFSGLANDLSRIADLKGNNPDSLALTTSNLPKIPNQDLVDAKNEALKIIKNYKYAFDADNFKREDHPKIPIPITDTPIDLGVGFPLIFGHPACIGSHAIPVELNSGKKIDIAVNNQIRENVMSYWVCDPAKQKFSHDQVRRMEYVLKEIRPYLISRTIPFNEVCISIEPILVKRPDWWWTYIIKKIQIMLPWKRQKPVSNNKLDKIILNTFGNYIPWEKKGFKEYLKSTNSEKMIKGENLFTNSVYGKNN